MKQFKKILGVAVLVSLFSTVSFARGAVFSLTRVSNPRWDMPHKPLAGSAGNQSMSYSFGQVARNSRVSVAYKFSNTGDLPLNINEISIEGPGFDADHNCPAILPKKGSCLTWIYFWPAWEGFHTGRLIWSTAEGDLVLNLSGFGV